MRVEQGLCHLTVATSKEEPARWPNVATVISSTPKCRYQSSVTPSRTLSVGGRESQKLRGASLHEYRPENVTFGWLENSFPLHLFVNIDDAQECFYIRFSTW